MGGFIRAFWAFLDRVSGAPHPEFIAAMSPTSLRTRIFAAVLLLPLVALATATDSVGLRCRVTGVVQDACCCPDVDGDGDAGPANAAATVSPADCCDRIVREISEAPAELAAPATTLPNRATALALVAFADAGARLRQNASSLFSSRSADQAGQRPPSLRLRLVTKSAFLI
ncbi:MAG: hypothetical protein QOI66_477 [Myxococcales bacterium]|jgi:hypothetical protein|nr:hypothetical protein [Myxococcales bacterium]